MSTNEKGATGAEAGNGVVCLDEEAAAGITNVESSPGLKQFGIQSLTLHKDARQDLVVTVDPSRVFDLSANDIAKFRLWDDPNHYCRPGQRLPEQLRRGPTYAFTAVNDHWEATRADYLQVSFFQPCQVYLLLSSTGRVPLWVRDSFTKVPESKCALAVDWKLAPHVVLLAMMSQKLAAVRNARLHLWECKQPCVPGQLYKFGGAEGLQGLDDYTHIFVWRPLGADELASLEARAGPAGLQLAAWEADAPEGAEGGEVTAQGRAANVRRRAAYMQRMVQAVMDDDVEQLQRACRAHRKLLIQTTRASAPVTGAAAGAAAAAADAATAARESGTVGAADGAGSGGEVARWLRPSFLMSTGRPLTAVAAALNVQPRLVLYLVSQGAEVDSSALRFILNNARALPTGGYRDVRHFLLSYIMHQRNPVTCAMVFAQFLDEFAETSTAKAQQYGELAKGLRALAVHLVEFLDKLAVQPGEDDQKGGGGAAAGGDAGGGEGGGSGGDGNMGPAATLADILAPQGVVCTINDYSPLQVAYETNDLEFMSASVVQGYLQDRWLGAGYIANCLVDKGEMIHFGDNRLVLKVMSSAGFVGSLGRKFAKYPSYTMHIVLLASRPFFDSPRGRWCFRLLCEAFFLYCFHSVQLMRDQERLAWQHPVLILYVASMLVDELQEVMHQYHGRLGVYFGDGFNVVEATAMVLLVASGACKAAMLGLGSEHAAWPDVRTAKDFLFNTASIFVWARLLQYIIPLYDGVGSLLMVVSNMFREVIKFAVPGVILLMGVAFTMYSTFRDRDVPQLESFPSVLLLLFRTFLGETMFEVLEDENSTLYNLYGNIIVLLYALTATVVLANLLIALISYHFKPEKVESQSRFQMAEILQHYEYMVEHQLIGAPFSLPQLLLASLLPSGWRRMAPASTLHTAALMPIDGNPVSNESRDSKLYPTGSREVPYLFFLVTAYPLLLLATWVMCIAFAPYCILFFALYGYRRWVPDSGDASPSTAEGAAAAGGAATTSETRRSSRKGGGARVAPEVENRPHQQASFGTAGFGDDDRDEAEAEGATRGPRISMVEISGDKALVYTGSGKGGGGEDSMLEPVGLGPAAGLYPEWNTVQRMRALARLVVRVLLYILFRPLWIALGAFVYLGALVCLISVVWLGVYTWGGRLVYTMYWVLHGWIKGWFSDGLPPKPLSGASASLQPSQSQSQAQSAARSGAGPATAAARRATWVRIQQAGLRDGGQVLEQGEIADAMRRAGFAQEEVDAAVTGAWAYAPAPGGGMGRGTTPPQGGAANGRPSELIPAGKDKAKKGKKKEKRKAEGSQRTPATLQDSSGGAGVGAGGIHRVRGGSGGSAQSGRSGRWTVTSSSSSESSISSSDEERRGGADGTRNAAKAPPRISPSGTQQQSPQQQQQAQLAMPDSPMRVLRGLLGRVQALEADLQAALNRAGGL